MSRDVICCSNFLMGCELCTCEMCNILYQFVISEPRMHNFIYVIKSMEDGVIKICFSHVILLYSIQACILTVSVFVGRQV